MPSWWEASAVTKYGNSFENDVRTRIGRGNPTLTGSIIWAPVGGAEHVPEREQITLSLVLDGRDLIASFDRDARVFHFLNCAIHIRRVARRFEALAVLTTGEMARGQGGAWPWAVVN